MDSWLQIPIDPEKKYRCEVCYKVFLHNKSLTVHRRVHTGERPYTCPICGNTFRYNSSYGQHLKSIHKIYKNKDATAYKCDKCNKFYESLHALRCHNRIHETSDNRPYGSTRPSARGRKFHCHLCKFGSNFKASLRRHIRTVHKVGHPDDQYTVSKTGPTVSEVKSMVVESQVTAGVSGPTTSSGSSATRKQKTGSFKPEMKCRQCKKVFKSHVNLKHHVIFCGATSEHKCNICGKDQKMKWMLERHMLLAHERRDKESVGARKHVCQICQKPFKDMYMLRMHMRIHSDDRPYECSVCKATFKVLQHLTKHMQTHEKAKQSFTSFICTYCGAGFNTDFRLTLHVENIHKNEANEQSNNESSDGDENSESEDRAARQSDGSELSETLLPTGTGEYVCDICGLDFSKRSYLTNHIKKHIGRPEPGKEYTRIGNKAKEQGNVTATISLDVSQPPDKSKVFNVPISDRYLKLNADERKQLQSEINDLFLVSREAILASMTNDDQHKYECYVCVIRFTVKDNLMRHVRNRPFDHVSYFKRRLVPLQTDPLNISDTHSTGGSSGNKTPNKQKPGPTVLKALRAFINLVLNKMTGRKDVEVTTHASPKAIPEFRPPLKVSEIPPPARFSGFDPKRFYCDVCGNAYTRRVNMMSHRQKHTDGELRVAIETRKLQKTDNEMSDGPRVISKHRESGAIGSVETTGYRKEAASTAPMPEDERDDAEIYMDTADSDVDNDSDELLNHVTDLGTEHAEQNQSIYYDIVNADDEVPVIVDDNDDAAADDDDDEDGNDDDDDNDADVAGRGCAANVDDDEEEEDKQVGTDTVDVEEQIESESTGTTPQTVVEINKDNTFCQLCRLEFLENQKTITCHLCAFRFCLECVHVTRDLQSQHEEAGGVNSTGYIWMCDVCKPMLPRLSVVMKQLGQLEQCLNDRMTDIEKKVSGIQQLHRNDVQD